MSNTAQHIEWRSLIEISGPFLAASVLENVFPQGLDAVETPRRQKLRAAYEEWRDAVNEEDPLLPELHQEWIRLVLTDLLEYDSESLISAADWAGELPSVSSQENTGTFSPDWLIHAPGDEKARLFISIFPPDTNLESSGQNDGWPASLLERMTLLCRAHGVRLGLLSNGERWMLVNAPEGSTSGQASWYARLWFQEPLTLKAFRSLLGVRRCFGPAETTLEALLEESLKHQEEVTDTLGAQVRRAVEVLIQCLDKADEDRNRELLRDVSPTELYEAGLTVMMRLVFILCAEERGLLLSGDPLYDQCYAVSTLRGQLSGETPEILERRHDAWARLLAIFRGVYGGIEHQDLRLPALGGSLFDPDRFPFLEGRAKGTRWRDVPALPLPIDNRTVLLLLSSLQILEQSTGALLLSYRALDVEQIGHVYEGLLEHTVARVPKVTLGLKGTQSAKDPNIPLAELESVRLDGAADLVKRIRKVTWRSESAIKNDLKKVADEHLFSKVIGVCGSDMELAERIRPFTNLLRTDAWEDPIIYRASSFMVTLGADRRETGTHYTPKSLTESIVSTTLEPIVYSGPSEGKPREEWELKAPQEILDLKVCDPAMGSGAFLVQACRYLGERLVEAWLHAEEEGKKVTIDGEMCDSLDGAEPMPSLKDERLTIAKRLVAERCLYGVDINPLAVELAKLSIWLVTLAKGHPFGFLDHNLRPGDSLLGIHKLEQLIYMTMTPGSGQYQLNLFGEKIKDVVQEAIELRIQLRTTNIRDILDIENMVNLNQNVYNIVEPLELIADTVLGAMLQNGGNTKNFSEQWELLTLKANDYLMGNSDVGKKLAAQAKKDLTLSVAQGHIQRKPFHWALEFPEVFSVGGFDALVGNPPYLGAPKLTGTYGEKYREFLVNYIAHGMRGLADLCAYFLLRAEALIRNLNSAIGFIVTSAISEGDTRSVGLQQLTEKGWSIFKAKNRAPWPGSANVTYSLIHACPYTWNGKYFLNDAIVSKITPFLDEIMPILGTPKRLKENRSISFNGVKVYGKGFVIKPEEAYELIKADEKNRIVLFPYITTKELNSHPTHQHKAWAIRFFDWPLDRESAPEGYSGYVASDFPECLKIVEERVKPERTRRDKSGNYILRDPMPRLWWIYGEKRPGLYKAITKLKHVLAVGTQATKYVSFAILDKDIVYSHSLSIIASDSFGIFAVLSSSIHEIWARQYGSYNLSLLRYSPTDLFETFPFPHDTKLLEEAGLKYYNYRKGVMLNNQEGFTDIYNKFHSEYDMSSDIMEMRKNHVMLDNLVINSYGWSDLNLNHDFIDTPQGIRYTICQSARVELVQRLLALNHKRYTEESFQRVSKNLK